ncbi:MAG: dihydrofolate reductase [Gloeomargaritaceae cyanobacterium C42_A2020_066]|nr:dihydrofolate reductase [Gloeomargaritaceae cyanobacterium C42_A2020_066]
MRTLRLFIATSLDGFIAGPNGEIDWLFTDQDYGYAAFYATVDTLLMGRHTYEQILKLGDYPYPGRPAYVFSSQLVGRIDPHVTFIHEGWVDWIRTLKQAPGQTIWLVGGGQLIHLCLEHGLIDEIILSIHPLLLGVGIPLAAGRLSDPLGWQLVPNSVQTFSTGLLQATYRAVSPPQPPQSDQP